MISANLTPQTWEVVGGLITYGSLFAVTIRQNRKNRPVVLGVFTVSVFAGFLFFASLDRQHTPGWVLSLVALITVMAALCVLTFVVLDVVRWAKGKHNTADNETDQQSTARRLGVK
jgi:thiamine transporter ThiT